MTFVGTYSKFKSMQTCPKKFYLMEVTKEVKWGKKGEAAIEGERYHRWLAKAMEVGLDMPASMKDAQWVLDHVRQRVDYQGIDYEDPKQTILCEERFGITPKLKPCDFFADDVRFRGIIDLLIIDGRHAYIADYKNGKLYPDPEQLDDMALLVFAHFPQVDTITAEPLFIKHPDSAGQHVEQYERADVKQLALSLKKRFAEYARRIDEDDWPARSSGLCKEWCEVPNSICKFSGKAG